ncbi:hypothetical protein F2Q69_00041630 [Brassica cretica]|uniref:Uncharacterized protein n=1 Tax=Brassica cretica TaxID=69181 RepID=A0A8S9NF75_BRACR|nr:hypothetical protein F2Q69_00041630 [Brassica cretica]
MPMRLWIGEKGEEIEGLAREERRLKDKGMHIGASNDHVSRDDRKTEGVEVEETYRAFSTSFFSSPLSLSFFNLDGEFSLARKNRHRALVKSSVCSPTVRIIAFQAIDPGSTTVRHTELYRGSKNSETTLILTDARGQQVFDLHHLVGIQTEDAKSFAEILASWRHRLALDATNVENAFTEVLTQIYCINLDVAQANNPVVRLGSGCNAFVSQAIIRTETEHSPEITTQLMAMAMAEPRKLRGHKATATCCISSRDRPGLVVTSGEDGCVCWFDLRCKDVQFTIDVGTEPVSSLCFKTGNEDILYASHGNEIKSFDVHMLSAGSWKPLESYSYNKDEVNQVVCNGRSSFLASADDSGDVKIIDVGQKCLYKTLRAGHTSICSSVQFIPWRPWEVITGGLDAKLVLWDFSKGRSQKIIDFSSDNSGQCLNPAFVHSIAVPEMDMVGKLDKICAVAKGDGIVDLINIESELSRKGASKGGGSSSSSRNNVAKRVCLDYSVGGHKAAVSCVAFSQFQEKGRFLISGGNDKTVKIWDCVRCLDSDNNDNRDLLHLTIDLSKKVNWLCTNQSDSENLVVCDTTRVVKVYSIS